MDAKKDFFISYTKADEGWAEWIAWQLEEAEYTTVLQTWDFRPSSNFVLEMQQATLKTERTIAVLSPDYLYAKFTQSEWAAAFRQDPKGENGLLLPIRARECKPEGMLGQIVGPVAGDYPESVATTWIMNFDEVEKTSRASADVLRVSAFLHPDSIPLELLAKGASQLGPSLSVDLAGAENDPLVINKALGHLARYSLRRILL
jgi:hypothetical protein